MVLVAPAERTGAAAYTTTARYIIRPLGPVIAAASQSIALGLPFLLAGIVKCGYDVALWRWFRTLPLPGAAGAERVPQPDRHPAGEARRDPHPAGPADAPPGTRAQ